MPLLSRKRVIAAKQETVYGSTPSPAPGVSDCIRVTSGLDIAVNPTLVDRDIIRDHLGSSRPLPSNTQVVVTIPVELSASGALGTAPRYGPLLKACAMAETVSAGASVTYTPESTTFNSVTILYNIDGVLHSVNGCRGTFSISGNRGEIPIITFTMSGLYATPTDTAALVPTYGAQAEPLVFRAGNTLNGQFHSFAACMSSFSFDYGNTVVFRDLANCNEQFLITERSSTGNVQIEATTMAQKNYFTSAAAGTQGNFTFQHGPAANRVTLTCPTTTITSIPYADEDSIHMLNIGFAASAASAASGEVSLVFA